MKRFVAGMYAALPAAIFSGSIEDPSRVFSGASTATIASQFSNRCAWSFDGFETRSTGAQRAHERSAAAIRLPNSNWETA